MKILKTLHGNLKLPSFFPDATRGYIKGVNSQDLEKCKVQGVVVNTYHLLKEKLVDKISDLGGISKYMKFNYPIISDSGGFQVMSLIHRHPELGEIKEDKIIFNLDNKKIIFTPEKCIKLQMKIGADIIMCLDDCTEAGVSLKEQEKSVKRTIRWAEKCKKEFIRLTKNKKKKPMIFAIIQGGENKKLRKYCARELLKIGFDGYSFGGWPVKNSKLLEGILKYTANLIPNKYPKYAMGIGKPKDIIKCVKMGYNLFDCVIPTRDARHKRLYIFKNKKGVSYKQFYVRGKHIKDNRCVSNVCDCLLCEKYSRSNLCNMFKQKDKEFIRLATMHNLRFYSELMGRV